MPHPYGCRIWWWQRKHAERGVASLLLENVERWGLDRHDRQIFIEVSSKNHPMITLLQKLGFEFSGYNDHYYATKDVALFFGKLIK